VVDLDVSGERRPLPAGIELAAYRIVEHAMAAIGTDGGSGTSIRLHFAPDALEIEIEGLHPGVAVADEGPIAAAREQAAARGGSFSARPAGSGRTLVRAQLPLIAEHA
jgi:hypothetical protein